MPEYDEYGNHIDTTKFESYLSKLIVETRSVYEAVYLKITRSIKNIIEINQNNSIFDRNLFLIFSELVVLYPGYDNINKLLEPSFDINAANHFHKFFFEQLINLAVLPTPKHSKDCIDSLSKTVQNKISCNDKLISALRKKVYPETLFSTENRSRIEIEQDTYPTTQKLGIIADQHTPTELKNYYLTPYEPAQKQFKRNINGSISKTMQQLNMPYISGPSGTLGTCFSGMIQLAKYTPKELKLYFMILSASLVARGHHSFYEMQVVAETIGFKINKFSNPKDFYEQFLVEEFKTSKAYQNFIQSEQTVSYLSNMPSFESFKI